LQDEAERAYRDYRHPEPRSALTPFQRTVYHVLNFDTPVTERSVEIDGLHFEETVNEDELLTVLTCSRCNEHFAHAVHSLPALGYYLAHPHSGHVGCTPTPAPEPTTSRKPAPPRSWWAQLAAMLRAAR
jgi:hypothetical protein